MKAKKISVFEYTNYRSYLHDFYTTKKEQTSYFSYRYIARRVGFKSPGHFTQIIQGKANISIKLIERFVDFLGLSKREGSYFQYLVLFNQARTHEEKVQFFKKMTGFNEARVALVKKNQYEFYTKWYYTAIREMLSWYPFSDDYPDLANQLIPPITPQQAKEAITLLMQLKLITKNDEGHYKPTDSLISSGYDKTDTETINRFVLETMDIGKDALQRFKRNERNLSWVTLSVSPERYQMLIDEIRAFRRRLMQIANNDDDPSIVYQCNIQVFPVSKPKKL